MCSELRWPPYKLTAVELAGADFSHLMRQPRDDRPSCCLQPAQWYLAVNTSLRDDDDFLTLYTLIYYQQSTFAELGMQGSCLSIGTAFTPSPSTAEHVVIKNKA